MEIKESTFEGGTQKIDGMKFINCVFNNCTLEYSGGKPPSFIGCRLKGSNFAFIENADNTLAFLAAMYHGGFRPVVDATFDAIRRQPPKKEKT